MSAQKKEFILQLLRLSGEILKREVPNSQFSFREVSVNCYLPNSSHRVQINTEECTLVVWFKGNKVSRTTTSPHETIPIPRDKLSIADHLYGQSVLTRLSI